MENNLVLEMPSPTVKNGEWSMQIRNLKIAFDTPKGEFVAVKNINLNVKQGEIISIIGHSGCGKSTILNAIGGFIKPAKGEVLLSGQPVKGPGPDRGFVFQHYSLLPWFSVYKNIFEAVDSVLKKVSKEEKKQIVERYINAVGLASHKHKLPSEISGGMKQRVAIARAFAINPKYLLLDEPFGALDALTKSSMHIELLKLWNMDNRSKTILMVTHDIEEAIFLSDRIVVMTNGPAATIREIVEVNLQRPRNKKEIAHEPEYIRTRDHLISLLMDKVSILDYKK
ncbi:MAG: ABC transporter ATP-binding protein [Cytophagaceae bacterium]|nr:ABC transporter ATP-binding protein [Cytophagaceae bacterium]MDW8456048.1 ABC transporter ATP-binding protein [Cytophagaceae bacterium]